ncbi:MAG: DNA polymerase III subunit delta, partial [Rothia sp. (in: high G+C Gram-positive bacteria)]|nr:DNA polymerase III subunit delta [Rothia sp. (in: high G+C Gram-positive bacteria)]
ADALAYAQSPSDAAVVILSHTGGNRGKKLIDAVRASRSFPLVECKPLKHDRDKVSFVLYELREQGKKITPEAATALAQATSDTAELASAARQLAQDGPEIIDEATVDR